MTINCLKNVEHERIAQLVFEFHTSLIKACLEAGPSGGNHQSSAAITVTEKSLHFVVNGHRIPRQLDQLLLWATLRELDTREAWPACLAWAFHQSRSKRAFDQVIYSLNRLLRKFTGSKDFRIVSFSSGGERFYRLKLPENLTGNLIESDKLANWTDQNIANADVGVLVSKAIAGLQTNALLFQNFKNAREIINNYGSKIQGDHANRLKQALEEARIKHDRWLRHVQAMFDISRFASKIRPDIRDYRKALKFQIDFIRNLTTRRDFAITSDYQPPRSNPLNIVKSVWREGTSLGRRERDYPEEILRGNQQAKEAYKQIVELTEEMSESLLRLDLGEFPCGKNRTSTPATLLAALAELCQTNPTFWFPEPIDTPQWKYESAIFWHKAVMNGA